MPTYTRLPVSSFGPELMQLLVDGTREKKTVNLEQNGVDRPMALRRATALVARLNSLRAAMRREKHPHADMVMRAKCRKEGGKVIVEPRDSEFTAAIKDAGVIPTHEADPLPDLERAEYVPAEEGEPSKLLDLASPQPILDQKLESFFESISMKEK